MTLSERLMAIRLAQADVARSKVKQD